jgi:3-hydroxyisobutyrate dehydrogenase-like beta-hydroxyacid dehydrogenase
MVASGDRGEFERLRHVLSPLGHCDYVGPLGSAKTVKIINNFLVGIVTASNAEALSLGEALGLDLAELVGWLRDGPATSRVLESYMGRFVADGRYGDGLIGHPLMAKDLRLAAELAEALGCAMAFPRPGEQVYLDCGRRLGADAPFPSVFEHFRHARAPAPDAARTAPARRST